MIKKTQQIDPKKTEALIHQILAVGLEIRYVAVCDGIKVLSHQRQDLLQPSGSISDLYEELFVNPTLMKDPHSARSIGLWWLRICFGKIR